MVDKECKELTVCGVSGLRGELRVPGDKSISHRALILGSIAEGRTEVWGFLEGEDTLRTLEAFRLMGVEVDRPSHDRVVIKGRGLHGLKEPCDVIYAGNSGTTARLLTGLLSAQGFFSVITGDDSLRGRPMKRVVEPLSMMGASIWGRDDGRYLPLAIKGERLRGITYSLPVASAQVKSSILLAGLYAEGETVVEEPGKSRDHTERMLRLFGVELDMEERTIRIRKAKRLRPQRIEVPGDISSAAFFIVGATIVDGSELLIKDVGVNPTRTGIIDILQRMGASVEILNLRESSGEPVADILVRSSRLRGIDIDGEELLRAIDEFPVLCVAGAFAEGRTTISGAGELRVKESDRIAAMSKALGAVGIEVEERPDGIVIGGVGGRRIDGGRVDSHGDHRVAMAMAIMGLNSRKAVTVREPECINVSFPDFLKVLDGVKP